MSRADAPDDPDGRGPFDGGEGAPARRLERALVRLARDEDLFRTDLEDVLPVITEVAARALAVDRVSVWFLDEERETLRCADLYVRPADRHESGRELTAHACPSYLEAVRRERQIAADDVHADPRTRELSEGYTRPLGIESLLDSPVRLDGEAVGVVCHETVGSARAWTETEKMFAASVADFVTLALEGQQRRQTEERLREREERLQTLLETLPVGVLVHDRGEILFANPRVARILGVESAEELEGEEVFRLIPEEDRPRARRRARRILEEGEVAEPAQYRVSGTDGEEHWVEVTGRPLSHGGRRVVQIVARDVTERRRARARLEESERRYRRLFEGNVAGVFRSTVDGRFLECNQAFAEMFGFEGPDELREVPAGELYARPDGREEYLRTLREEGAVWNYEVQLRRRDGENIWVLENARLDEDPVSGEEVIWGTLIDVTEQHELREELERMAYHDPLTGLPNRRLLAEHGLKALALADRREGRAGLVYLDLARFKRINDTLGHDVGDAVLEEAADRLRSVVRESDTAARVGGDEFAVLLPGVEGIGDVRDAARRIRERLDEAYRVADHSFRVSAQIGIALYPDHAEDFAGLLSAADRAMYQAKRAMDVQVAVSRPGEEGMVESGDLVEEQALQRALERGELRVHYQPVYRVPEERPVAAEALARWEHPDRGLLDAGEFVPLAERSGIVRRMDRAVLEDVIRRMAEGREAPALASVAVNLAGGTLDDPELAAFVEDRLGEAGVAPERLILEVTERVGLRQPDRAAEALFDLRDLGVRIAIDDFGTGHASLVYLHRFPTDLLKLDLASLRRAASGDDRTRLVEGVLALGQRMGMTVVTEGVERREELTWLVEHGCELVQGRLLGGPVPPEELPAAGP